MLFFRRMAQILESFRDLSEEKRIVQNFGIAVSFEISQTSEYRAYLKLRIASLANPNLRDTFFQRARLYHQVCRAKIENVFPE